MRRSLIVALIVVGVGVLWLRSAPRGGPDVSGPQGAEALSTVELDVGMDAESREVWHHLDEGSGFFPLSFLQALEDAETGRPFLEVLPRYGMVPDPSNSLGLPVGLAAGRSDMDRDGPVLVGVTCSACHSGRLTYRGTAMNVDGAPNLLNFEALLQGLEASVEATVKNPAALLRLVHRIAELEHEPASDGELFELEPAALDVLGRLVDEEEEGANAATRTHVEDVVHRAYHAESPEEAARVIESGSAAIPDPGQQGPESEHVRAVLASVGQHIAYLKGRTQRLLVLRNAFKQETEAGPGRADSFNAIWDLLVAHKGSAPMNAPVSIPHLFEYADFRFVHWDGNTSTVLGRDYAQAIALGGSMDATTGRSTVVARNVMALEAAAKTIKAPGWPTEILGQVDRERASQGEALFQANCASCHSGEVVVPVREVGTDGGRTVQFAERALNGTSYADLLDALGTTVTRTSFAAHNVSQAEADAVRRVPDPEWRITRGYVTRRLNGVWASAPYLHNGSVPTLWALLQAPENRPPEFQVGREFDPVDVGVDVDGQGPGAFVFRTSETGNGNGGHAYGVELSDQEKRGLVEYLKTR